MIILIVAADSYEAWQDYRRVLSDNEHLQLALGRALTEQAARMLQEADVALASFAAFAGSTEGRAATQEELTARLNHQVARLPFIQSARVGPPNANATRDLLEVDARRASLLDGARTFALSRPILTPEQHNVGSVTAQVSLAYLGNFYAQVNVNADTAIRLMHDDGSVIAEYPQGMVPAELNASIVSGSSERQPYLRSDARGHEYINLAQRVDDYPVMMMISRSLASVLAPWIAEERSSAARTLTLGVLAAVLIVALRSALARQERMDQETRRLESELAGVQRVEALGFLAASVTHDFNNVLTAIIGYAELAREAVTADSEVGGNIERLLAAGERARLLVRRVLTFDPRRSVSYRPIAIQPIVMEVIEQVRATLPAAIEVSLHLPAEAITVAGDATELYQVVMNLCSNAVHAMPSGGRLVVQVGAVDVTSAAAKALGTLTPGRWAELVVRDSGIGVDAGAVGSMFEPFYTTRQPGKGTGIGLAVVRNIILQMSGALQVDSRANVGTTMTVYWPLRAPAAREPVDAIDHAAAGQTVMVVDDEQELVSLTEELLASMSYEPVGFSDARLALEAFRSDPQRFDLILTDDRMGSLRGLELAQAIRALDSRVPIVLMTGHRDADVDAAAKRMGIAEIIDKPLRVQGLREALARQI